MKKVVLFVAMSLMGIATFSQNPWQFNAEAKEIQIKYNPYGMYDDAWTSVQWQASCRSVLIDAVEATTGSRDWTPQVGQGFLVRITGVANNTGLAHMAIADGREEAGWFTLLSQNWNEVQVTKGEPFVLEGTIFLDNVTHSTTGEEVEGGLSAAELVLGFTYAGKSSDEGFNAEEPFTISDATMNILFSETIDVENPLVATYEKQLEGLDSYQYQSATKSKLTFDDVYSSAFVNVSFTGKALADMEKISYMMAEYSYKNLRTTPLATSEAITFAENVQSGDVVTTHFSFPLNKTNFIKYDNEGFMIFPYMGDCILAESAEEAVALYFENASISVDMTDKQKYQVPDGIISEDDYVVADDEVIVEAERAEAFFTMPINEGADSYTLTIKHHGETVCSLTFNAQGQLANIDFSDAADCELKSDVLAYQFTVTGLSEGTSYGYNFKAFDNNKIVLKEYEGEFTTKEGASGNSGETGATAISEVSNASSVTIVNSKIFVDGEAPAFVVTISGQKIANANLQAGVYFVVVDGKTIGISVR